MFNDIKEALSSGSTEIESLVKPYIAKVIINAHREIATPTNVKVDSIAIPMTNANVTFTYNVTEDTNSSSFGQFKFTEYKPIGTTISIAGMECTVVGYSEPVINTFGNGYYYLDMIVESNSALTDGARFTNAAVEEEVLDALNRMIYSNERIGSLLADYTVNTTNLFTANQFMADNEHLDTIRGIHEKIMDRYVARVDDDMQTDNFINADTTELVNYYKHAVYLSYGTATIKVPARAIASEILLELATYGSIDANSFIITPNGDNENDKHTTVVVDWDYSNTHCKLTIRNTNLIKYEVIFKKDEIDFLDEYYHYTISNNTGITVNLMVNNGDGEWTASEDIDVTEANLWKLIGELIFRVANTTEE